MDVSVFCVFVDSRVGSIALQIDFENVFGDIGCFYWFLLG